MVLDPNLIPGFEIQGRLASGGVAEVFRATRRTDGQLVALKVMSLNELDPEFHPVERFKRESSILERLNHPTLPRFYGYGVTEGGLGWLAIELVPGQPLTQHLGRPASELVPVFIQIAEGLQAVAQEGIIHRDISPDNILVEERHGRLSARLIDFGVAKDLLSGEGGLTRHGAFIGKLAYASPEQLVGLPRGQTIDFRSDVYSLGLVMYEALAGRRAIEGDSLPEIVDAHLKTQLPPLLIPPERGGPAPRLVFLVMRMCAKRREERPASWEEIVAELWRSREEVSPLHETLARKRAGTGSDSSASTQQAIRTALPELGDALSREVLIGRLVLGFGAAAFLGSLVFAVSYIRSQRNLPTPLAEPTAVPAVVRETPPAHPTPSPVGGVSGLPRPTEPAVASNPPKATRPPRPTAPPQENGVLEVALTPAGDLEELADEKGRVVARRRPLPVSLELPPGRYRLRITARGVDCSKTVNTSVQAGRTTSIRETCIEVK